jgi:predicted RNA-binding protein with PUA-like domain
MAKNYWLIKSEPDTWSWQNQIDKKTTAWDGVRNYQARNNLKAMQLGDLCFFYHSNIGKEIVGIVKVVKTHYPDVDPNFVCVDVEFFKTLNKPVSLASIKSNADLQDLALVKHSRLSVMPVSKPHFNLIVKLGETEV